MIKPTVGRVVWFHPASNEHDPGFAPAPTCAAIVAFVHSDFMVNLTVFDANGISHSKTSVPLVQDGYGNPDGGCWCEWMPFQKGQASKTEELAARLARPEQSPFSAAADPVS